jgi:uncharacterized protein (DUF305 family)
MRTYSRHFPAVLAVALGLTLTACASDDSALDTSAGGTATSAASPAPGASSSAAAFNDTDVRFTQKMLPHHMQAARNAEIEIAMGADPEVKAIAQKILDTQTREIEQMQGFLQKFGAAELPAPADQQAVWDKNTADLRAAATPAARDIVFLTNMVPHHSAAVPMSQNEIDLGAFPEAIALAEEIKKTQRMEIMQMNKILRAKSGAA